jgi:5-methylthioadenosine/S-adenosylhomocysteine deaminase
MTATSSLTAADLAPGRSVVFRNATVLTLDDGHDVLDGADVLVSGERIAAVGPNLAVPEGTAEIDAAGGILMPGMIDTHRHMWQTAMRGYGADWTLTQYFVWYYLQWGKTFRPQDIYAGNLLAAIEAIDAGVTTTVDWSHGLQTVEHADAAVDALTEVPGRFVLAYGNIQQGPWEWSAAPEFREFVSRRFGSANDMLGFQMAFDVTGDPSFPEKAAFEVARELDVPVTTHAGVWGATNDDGIRLMHEGGFMTPSTIYVHAATLTRDSYNRIAATGGSASVSTESEQSAGQGTRLPGSCASTTSPSHCRWIPACGGAATCSRPCGQRSGQTVPASTSRRTASRRPSPTATCAPRTWSTSPPAAAPGPSASTRSSAASSRARRPTWS